MNGKFTLKVSQPWLKGERILALREDIPWDEVCDLLKNVGDDSVVVEVMKGPTRKLMLCPMGQVRGFDD